MANVDFTEQISNFRSATYGKDVRESLIDLAEAVEDAVNNQLVTVDATLKESGQGADAAVVGQELSDLKSEISSNQGLTAEFKTALENFAKAVAFKSDDPLGQTYIDALHTAMYPPANLSRITAVFNQGINIIYDTDTLDTLKQYLTVTAYYDNSTSEIVTTYTLSGTLSEGTSTITVSYGGKTATFNVTVTEAPLIQNGTYTFATTGEVITITNHNHFAITLKASASGTNNGCYINLSDLTKNGASSTAANNGTAINNLSDVLYTFPANAEVTLKLLNPTLSRTDVIANASKGQLVISFRKTGTSTTVIAGGVGFPLSSAGGGNKFENTVTIAEETEASCLFMYYGYSNDVTIEFDLEMTVNGAVVI